MTSLEDTTMDVPASAQQIGDLDMASAANVPQDAKTEPKFESRWTPQSLFDRIEAFVSRLSVRDNFWHSICSLVWLPLAFFSGIQMKQVDAKTFAAYLPFR